MSAVTGIAGLRAALDDRTVEILEHRRRRAQGAPRRRGWLMRRALLVADVLGLVGAFVLVELIYAHHSGQAGLLSPLMEFLAFGASLPVWLLALRLYGLYDQDEERTDHSTADDFSKLLHLMTVCAFLLFAVAQLIGWSTLEFSKLLTFWLIAIAAVTTLRSLARSYCRRSITYLQNTVIVGAGDIGQSLARKLLRHPEYGLNLVGFIDSNPKERQEGLEHLTVLGGLDELFSVVELLDVERVIVAFTGDTHSDMLERVSGLRDRDVQVDIVPRLFENLDPSVSIRPIEGIPLVGLPPTRLSRSSLVAKRVIDVVIASAAMCALFPLFAVVAIAVRLDSPGPVFYRHARVGRGGRPIRLLKFRTMYRELCRGSEYGGASAEAAFQALLDSPERRAEFEATFKLRDDPRVTRVGAFLRRTSIDELPQLWNVLRGEISMVGPRALTHQELEEYYGVSADTLLAIKPGVTGYWQVNGRSDLEYVDRVRLDLAYVGGWSMRLDFSILFKTVRVLLAGRGAV